MWLPAAYIKKSNGKYYVWLDSHNKLKLQEIKVGEYDENLDEYEVKSGLKTTDYIACDDSTLKEGMRIPMKKILLIMEKIRMTVVMMKV